jgi:hypothetical protein
MDGKSDLVFGLRPKMEDGEKEVRMGDTPLEHDDMRQVQ